MGSNGIVHNTEDWLSGKNGFLVNHTDYIGFQDFFKSGTVPFPVIQKMGNCCSVMKTCFGKINGFPSVTINENRDDNRHQVTNINIG